MAGLSTTALFIAKSVVSLVITAVGSGIFLSFWAWLAQPVAPAGLYYLLIWLTYFAGTSLGFLFSILLRYDLAGMVRKGETSPLLSISFHSSHRLASW